MKRSVHQGEGATSAPSVTAPVMETINPLDVAEIEGLDGAEFEDEAEEDENGTEPAEEEDDDEQEEEKAPEEDDDPAPWFDHNQEHIISYDEWVTKCTHKAKDGRKFMACHACNKALKRDNDTGLWNHHMALNCCPPKVLGQWAKEWSLKQKRIKTAEEVAEHLKMKEPKWESVKKEPPVYMTAHLQKMMDDQEEEDNMGPKTPKQRRVAKTPPHPEKKGKTKEERVAWFKSSTEGHLERFREPASEAPRQICSG